ncbi:MAG: flagellar accessory protein FlaH [Methanomicrobiales archaeon]|nr:flagellar accessory protein FlaH [Methanomicrobiales archaeon]MDD1671357.1 flagellar accessory protein FlaH [Methanomicrobiales archaeon]
MPDEKKPDQGDAGRKNKDVLLTGKHELDKKIDDGIPLRSLTLIEGEHDSGKSVLTQQIVWGGMKQGLNIDIISSETTARNFITQMEDMRLDISEYYAWGYIRLFPIVVPGLDLEKEDMEELLQRLLVHIRESPAQVIIIDSLTLFTEHTTNEIIIDFFNECKNLCDRGKTILVSLHPYAFDEDTLVRIRATCDIILTLKRALMGDKYLMVLEVVKIRGAHKTRENVVSFEIIPGAGMKIIPISVAKV